MTNSLLQCINKRKLEIIICKIFSPVNDKIKTSHDRTRHTVKKKRICFAIRKTRNLDRRKYILPSTGCVTPRPRYHLKIGVQYRYFQYLSVWYVRYLSADDQGVLWYYGQYVWYVASVERE